MIHKIPGIKSVASGWCILVFGLCSIFIKGINKQEAPIYPNKYHISITCSKLAAMINDVKDVTISPTRVLKIDVL